MPFHHVDDYSVWYKLFCLAFFVKTLVAMNSNRDLLKVFGNNVRRQRAYLKISQEELAERTDLHRTYIGMIERAEKNVTLLNIERIANALLVPIERLLSKDEHEEERA